MLAAQEISEGLRRAMGDRGKRKFVQSVELQVNLRDIDLKKPENRFTETVELPRGLGSRPRRVAVIAGGALAVE
ncbi:MAG: 50S ribosomal protein L1, partial [Nitrososphaeria archaeon]|nr:50S ribosomal protein L1 [Nitrososphaeria archaeon]